MDIEVKKLAVEICPQKVFDYFEGILRVQKNNKEYCKIYNGCLKHFLASITKYNLPEEKIHCFAIKCYIVL